MNTQFHVRLCLTLLALAALCPGSPALYAQPQKDGSNTGNAVYTDNEKKAALALGGIASVIYGISETTVSPVSVSDKSLNPEKWKTILSRDWGVTGRDDLLKLFGSADGSGYSNLYADYVKLLNVSGTAPLWKVAIAFKLSPTQTRRLYYTEETRANIGSRGLKAWDYGSLITIARWGLGAGYITEQEAWDRILYFSGKIHDAYNSWEDYAANYIIGRGFYYAAEFEREAHAGYQAYYTLISDPQNPWVTVRWNASGRGGAMEKNGAERPSSLSINDVCFQAPAELRAWERFIDGWTSYSFGDVAGAAENYARCIEIDPSISAAYINQALVLAELGRYKEAVSPIQTYIRMESKDPQGYHALFQINAKLGKDADAIRAVDTAIALSIPALPQDPSYYAYLADKGIYLTEIREFRKALPVLLEAATTLKAPLLYLYIGDCYVNLGDIANAATYYRTAGYGGAPLNPDQERIANMSPPREL